MEDKISRTNGSAQGTADLVGAKQGSAPAEKGQGESLEKATQAAERASVGGDKAVQEHRKAYGTAKTEDLRDSGLWRFLLPAFIVLACLALFAVPLLILGPLLYTSLDPHAQSNVNHYPLTWIWITMVVIEVGIAAVVVYGLVKIFMTQAGNYRR